MSRPVIAAPTPAPSGLPAAVPATLAMAVAILAAGWLVIPQSAVAADPPSVTPASCAERYPVDGPAGLDLQLGCVAAEIVASYTGAAASSGPARISSWLVPLAALSVALAAILWLGVRVNRRLDRRMAPVAPDVWWTCPRCRSLNLAHVARCYACGETWTPAALTLDTDAGLLQPGVPDAPPPRIAGRPGP